MSRRFTTPIRLLNLSSDPSSATEGDLYWNSTSNIARVYYDSAWHDLSSSLVGTLPAGGTAGQILAKIDGIDYNTEWIDNYTSEVKHQVKLGASISKGQAVYVSSAVGTNMIVSKASNATEATSSKTMGLLETGGVTNDFVYVITEGLLAGLDTSSAGSEGDPVWLGTSGNLIYGLTNKPVAPAHLVFIGIVTRKHATQGEIFVKIQNGFELNELHNVLVDTTPEDNEVLAYDTTSGLWINQTASEAGLATSSHDHSGVYQPLDGDLTAISNISADGLLKRTGTDAWGTITDNTSNWNTAYGWGNHASAGYLTSFTETDPIFTAHAAYGVTSTKISHWDTAYGWGNHASAGYLTSYTETQTLANVTSLGATTSSAISITNSTTSTSSTTGAFKVTGGVGIGENLFVGGNLDITGNFTVHGTQTILSTTNLSVSDSLIYLSDSQFTVDSVDIGIYGAYGTTGHNTSGDHYHTGLVRKAGGGWHLFSAGPEASSGSITLTSVTYDSLKIGSLDVTDSSTTRTNLGLAIGTNVQAYSSVLAGIVTLGSGTGFLKNTAGTWSYDNSTYLTTSSASSTYLTQSNATSTYAPLASPTFTGTVTIPAGASISGYLTTSSASSTYAPLASPTFTGTVTIPAGASISGYLTTSSASSTYLTQSNASSTYLTQSSASSTYAALSGASFTGDVSTSGVLKSTMSAANEGGQIELSLPSSGSTLSGTNVTIDVYQDKLRIFESGGTNRGAYIPLTSTTASVGTSLLSGTTGAMNYEQQQSTKVSGVSASGVTIVSRNFTTNGYPVQVLVTGDAENSTSGGWVKLQLYRDSTAIGKIVHVESSAASENVPFALTVIDTPAAGTYTYALKTVSTVSTGTMNFGETDGPVLTMIELSGPKGDTGAAGASSNAFTTISVSGQSDVVADQTSDTLTLVAGSNITITTNATSDSITISSTAAGGEPTISPFLLMGG